MKILVTGGTGFLGQHLAQRLVSEGNDVTVIGRNARVGSNLIKKGIKFVQGDLADLKTVKEAVSNQEYVIHCGALSSPWGKYADFYAANVTGTQNIITACQESKIKRLVHVSTPSIYVDQRDRLDILESDKLPMQAINDYAHTKRMAEELIDKAFAQGLPVITIRPQGIFGPGDRAILPRLIKIAKKGFMPVIGKGDNLIDLTYVDNVVEALILCLTSPDFTLGKKYNITNGEPVKLYDAIGLVLKSLGINYKEKRIPYRTAYVLASGLEGAARLLAPSKEPPLTRYSVCVLAKSRTLSIDAARKDLGYKPIVGMTEGISRFVKSYKEEEAH
jgi:nucleoside-diphosphate-sugar epimerase